MFLYRRLSLVLIAFSASISYGNEVLRSIAELEAFNQGGPNRIAPLELHGTITGVGERCVILRESGSATLLPCDAESTLSTGNVVIVRGQAEVSSENLPRIRRYPTFEIVGTGPVPPVLELPLSELDEKAHNFRNVSVSGTVIDFFRDEIDPSCDFLLVKDSGAVMPVCIPHGEADDRRRLVDARIRVTGLFNRTVSGTRQYSGPFIGVKGKSDISILKPPPDDPFDHPPLENVRYLTPRDIAHLGKRRVSGIVLANWGKRNCLIRTDDGRRLRIETVSNTLPAVRSRTTFAGYPETDLYRINLSKAVWRSDAASNCNDQPEDITIDRIRSDRQGEPQFDPSYFGRLIRLEGIVRNLPPAGSSDGRFNLECGPFLVPVDASGAPKALESLAVGAKIEATGVCLLETANWQPHTIFPRIRELVLILRAPEDIRTISPAPWWTPGRLLAVIAALLAALAAFFVRNRILKRIGKLKIGERTRLAVELHDSLSQNLSAVACQVAAARGTLTVSPATAAEQLETVEKMLQSSRTELKRCLWDLRSDALGEKAFSNAIRKALGPLATQADVQIRFNVPRNLFDDTDAHAILSIIRELAANAIVHGRAGHVRIAGDFTDGVFAFSVRDDGCGFDPDLAPGLSEGHFGLQGIRERVKKLKGELAVESVLGGPTRITVRIKRT